MLFYELIEQNWVLVKLRNYPVRWYTVFQLWMTSTGPLVLIDQCGSIWEDMGWESCKYLKMASYGAPNRVTKGKNGFGFPPLTRKVPFLSDNKQINWAAYPKSKDTREYPLDSFTWQLMVAREVLFILTAWSDSLPKRLLLCLVPT